MSKNFLIFAHRGASGYEFENSLSAFKKAIQLKADFIETDVRKTKDKELILVHDNNLSSLTNYKMIVSRSKYHELKNIKLNNNESIPRLDDLLELQKGQIKLNLEIKVRKIEETIIHRIKKYDLIDQVVFSSFSLKTLRRIKKIEPSSKLHLIFFYPNNTFYKRFQFKKLVELGISALSPLYAHITDDFIKNAFDAGLKIYPWTVNDALKVMELKNRGINGIITDYPDILSKLKLKSLQN